VKKLRTLVPTVAAAALVLATAAPSQAMVSNRYLNHIRSLTNVSYSDTNPPRSGHIFSMRPGYAGQGQCVYFSSAYWVIWYYETSPGSPHREVGWKCYTQLQVRVIVRVLPL
jgi:hypothetical protein